MIESTNEEDFKVEQEGSIIIQGKYILDIVRKLPDKYINIEFSDITNVSFININLHRKQ